MNALNFLPLLVWMLGFPALLIWDAHLRRLDGKDLVFTEESLDKTGIKALAQGYLVGIVFWLLIAALLTWK